MLLKLHPQKCKCMGTYVKTGKYSPGPAGGQFLVLSLGLKVITRCEEITP